MNERQVVSAVASGDAEAIASFVREYDPLIRRDIRQAGIPACDLPDVSQDIIIEAIRQLSLNRFEHRASLRTWIHQVTHGRITDYWRATTRRGRSVSVSLEMIGETASEFQTPAAQEVRLVVEETLAAMPARHRLAITAHCRSGVSVHELARIFGLSVPRTRNIITEAKRLFRQGVCGKTSGRRRLSRVEE